MGKPFEYSGPPYPDLGMEVHKFRRLAKKRKLKKEEKQAYGEAVERAIRSLQRSEMRSRLKLNAADPKSPCASGTWHTDGDAIHKAIRQQQRRALLAYPEKARAARSNADLERLYAQAMEEKRRRSI